VNVKDLTSLLRGVFLTQHLMSFLAKRSAELVDGWGVKRVLGNFINTSILLRHAVLEDCELLFSWRNHPSTRRFFFDSNELNFSMHQVWFKKSIQSSACELLIGHVDGYDIGVLRFDYEENKAMVSIYLDPVLQGNGYGEKLLRSGIEWIGSQRQFISVLIAHVIEQNIQSKRVFISAGFKPISSEFIFEFLR